MHCGPSRRETHIALDRWRQAIILKGRAAAWMDAARGVQLRGGVVLADAAKESGQPSADVELREQFGFDAADDAFFRRVGDADRSGGLGLIGAYELLAEVGRGGQGVVFRARQPNTGREIAIKRMSAEASGDAEARARFQREIEAAAALDHPNIVTVYGSEVINGQPLLAMQWIDGAPIHIWAERDKPQRRAIREIVEVFLVVLDAVRHAHQRGIIHRDLKPSNLLVDSNNAPHVLDFGLAKLLAAVGAELTHTGDLLGTPAYAAPEQVRGDQAAVDVRTDVYALGVILYQTLTGKLPFSTEHGLSALLRFVQEDEAPPPSLWRSDIPADVDWIVLKAIEKRREERYQSVDAFAADLIRFRHGAAVEAHPQTFFYRARKFVRRNRAAVAGLSAFVLLLLAATTVSTTFYFRSQRSEQRAIAQAERSSAVLSLFDRMFAEIDPDVARGRIVTLREALHTAARRVESGEYAARPDVESAARVVLGRAFLNVGGLEEAERHLRSALATQRRIGGSDIVRLLSDLANLAFVHDRFEEADAYAREALGLIASNDDLPLQQQQYGMLQLQRSRALRMLGRLDESEKLLRDYLAAPLGASDDLLYRFWDGLGILLTDRQNFVEAEQAARRAIEHAERAAGADCPSALFARQNLASVFFARGDFAAAAKIQRAVIDPMLKIYGPDHYSLISSWNNLATSLCQIGEFAEAETAQRRAIELEQRLVGESASLALYENNLGDVLQEQKKLDLAEQSYRRSVEIFSKTVPRQNLDRIWAQYDLGLLLTDLGKAAEAEPLLRETVQQAGGLDGYGEFQGAVLSAHGNALLELGQFAECEAVLQACLKLRTELKSAPWRLAHTRGLIGVARQGQQFADAESLILESQRAIEGDDGAPAYVREAALQRVITLYEQRGESERAAEWRAKLQSP